MCVAHGHSVRAREHLSVQRVGVRQSSVMKKKTGGACPPPYNLKSSFPTTKTRAMSSLTGLGLRFDLHGPTYPTVLYSY